MVPVTPIRYSTAMETIKLNIGESGTVKRGKYRGQTAEVIAVNADSYACKLPDGEFAVIGSSNFRQPEEPTVTVRALTAALSDLKMESAGTVDVRSLLAAIDIVAPGASEHVATYDSNTE